MVFRSVSLHVLDAQDNGQNHDGYEKTLYDLLRESTTGGLVGLLQVPHSLDDVLFSGLQVVVDAVDYGSLCHHQLSQLFV